MKVPGLDDIVAVADPMKVIPLLAVAAHGTLMVHADRPIDARRVMINRFIGCDSVRFGFPLGPKCIQSLRSRKEGSGEAIPPCAPSARAQHHQYDLADVFRSSLCGGTAFLGIAVYAQTRRTCSHASKYWVGAWRPLSHRRFALGKRRLVFPDHGMTLQL
jgi:hypothetical protein